MLTVCITCEKEFEAKTKARKYCSKKCNDAAQRSFQRICNLCGDIKYVKRWNACNAHLCLKCAKASHKGHPTFKSGSENLQWKGGHRYYSRGRFCSDSNGLTWKSQRKLCLQRDNYTCQGCGVSRVTEGPSWTPAIHHKTPWMYSHSHEIDNLVCLCNSCHMKEERKWHKEHPSMTPLEPYPSRSPQKTGCASCGNIRRKQHEGLCLFCFCSKQKQAIQNLREKGYTYEKIASILKFNSRHAVRAVLMQSKRCAIRKLATCQT